jgi:phenylacetic acid degradation protein PaaD
VGLESREDELAEACAAAMWAADAAAQALGVAIDRIRAGFASIRMTVTPTMVNGHDVCHGGYVFLLADTAFAYACNTYDAAAVAAGCDIVFVAPAHAGDELVAEAVERTLYGRNGVYDVTVRGRNGAVVAEFRGRSRTTGDRILEGD